MAPPFFFANWIVRFQVLGAAEPQLETRIANWKKTFQM